jgi:hypothetical protein
VSIIRRHGIEPEGLVTRLATRMRDNELHEERLKKRFDLPPLLKHFALNTIRWVTFASRRAPITAPRKCSDITRAAQAVGRWA